jgi:hypothetical protein
MIEVNNPYLEIKRGFSQSAEKMKEGMKSH